MKLSIGRKLILAFLTLITLLLFVALIGVRSLWTMAREADAVAEVFREHDLFMELQLAMAQALEPTVAEGAEGQHQARESVLGEIQRRSEALAASLQRDGLDPRETELLTVLSSGVKALQQGFTPSAFLEKRMEAARAAHTVFARMDRFHQLHLDKVAEVVTLAERAKGQATRNLFLAVISATLIGIGLAFFLSNSITRPLSLLEKGAEALGSGNLGVRLKISIDDEVGRLAKAFNLMAERLQDLYSTLEQKVAERTGALARAHRELEEAHRTRQELLAKVISAQEEERRRIARELHDEASQAIATLVVNLEYLENTYPKEESQVPGRLRKLRGIATQTLEEIHKIIFDLRPRVLDDLGLVPAVSGYLESHLVPLHITYDLHAHGLDRRLPTTVETATFRIIQEAITNVIKHAQASHVRVTLDFDGTLLVVFVEDDGRGFETVEVLGAQASRRGMGLVGIRERAILLGGMFNIHSRPGGGTRLYVEIPIPAEVEADARVAV